MNRSYTRMWIVWRSPLNCMLLSCILLSFKSDISLAQYENVWTFGNMAGIDFNTNGAPTPIWTTLNTLEGCASVCDENGQLLFYTEGTVVFDRNHQVMPNGMDLTGLGLNATFSTTQGTLIVPVPEREHQYYLFSLVASTSWVSLEGKEGYLYYSLIDMSLNGGHGDVVAGAKGVFLDSNFSEHMTAVSGRDCNMWVLAGNKEPPYQIKAFRVTASGVSNQPIVSGGHAHASSERWGLGALVPSNNELKVSYNKGKLVLIYDFNPWTGRLSNAIVLDSLPSDTYYSSFSTDASKLYVTMHERPDVLQFDLSLGSASQIERSVTTVSPQSSTDNKGAIKVGPDNKIYIVNAGAISLDVIESPNLNGAACQYVSGGMPLYPGTMAAHGLPNAVPQLVPVDTLVYLSHLQGACFQAGQYVISANNDSAGSYYLWSTGDTTAAITISASGDYWVSYRLSLRSCKVYTDTFSVFLPPGTLPDINTVAACSGTANGSAYATTYPGDPVNYSYIWLRGNDTLSISDTLSGVSAGAYSLYVSTDTGCDTLLHFDIPEEDFRVAFEVSDTLICLGGTLQFTNTSDSHFTAFYWDLGNGDTFDVVTPLDYRYSENGSYRVLLAGTGEICSDTAYQTILVDQPIVPHFDVVPKEVCAGQPIYLRPYSYSTTSKISWTLGESAREESDVQQQYQHAFDRAGVYPVTLYSSFRACPDTSYTDTIRVYALPEIDLGSDTSLCLDAAPIYLSNLRVPPSRPYYRQWSTGDTSEVLKVVHPGIYSLTVTAEPIGCETTKSIDISKNCYIDIPNAFTPNGDGHNDYFLPRVLLSEGLNRFHMQVFNRWGQVVFETNRLDGRGWDGRFNDKAQPMGVYLYRIEADYTNARQEQYEGNVTLIR